MSLYPTLHPLKLKKNYNQSIKTMCITFFVLLPKLSKQKDVEFIIAFNRDENVDRKTKQFAEFQDDPNIYAGRDIKSGGTWLGFNKKTAIFVALTNFRKDRSGVSRGKLMRRFLNSDTFSIQGQQAFLKKLHAQMNLILREPHYYSPFNLILYSMKYRKIFYICSETNMKQPLELHERQCYGLCNNSLSDLWPKTQYGVGMFNSIVDGISEDEQENFMKIEELMKNKKKFNESQQETSIFVERYFNKNLESERMTKSTFIGIFRRKEPNIISGMIRQITHFGQETPSSVINKTVMIE